MPDRFLLSAVPGFREAAGAAALVMDSTASDDELLDIVQTVMAVSRPHVQAEVLADMSDYLAELGLRELADILDNVSAGIRKAVGSA